MGNKKDIGKAINDKLNSLDKAPREQVWNGINEELQKRKKKRRIAFFFFWTKTLGVLLGVILVSFYIYRHNEGLPLFSPDNSKDPIQIENANGETITISPNAKNPNTESNETTIKSSVATENKNVTESKTVIKDNNRTNKANKIYKKNAADSKDVANDGTNTISEKSVGKRTTHKRVSKFEIGKNAKFSKATAKNFGRKSAKKSNRNSKKEVPNTGKKGADTDKINTTESNQQLSDLSALENKKDDEQTTAIKSKKTDSVPSKKEKPLTVNMFPKDSVKQDSAKVYRKFYIDAFVSPTFYGNLMKESVLDKDLDTLSKKSTMKFSYGVGLSYDLSERISVRIGYTKVNLSYTTKNAPIGVNAIGTSDFTGIAYNPNVSNQTIYIASNGSEKMDITQKISYTEIPVEIKYQFLNKKVGLKSSLGFSYLLLDANKVSIRTLNGYSQEIGKTKNLSQTSFSFNIGMEIEYPLFKNTKIFVEPLFSYQVKAFSDNNSKPYIIGIHSGIRYSINNK